MKKQFKITIDQSGKRLDQYLSEFFSDLSRSHLQNLIKQGHILVNNSKVKTGYMMKTDDLIDMYEVEPQKLDMKGVNLNLEVVYEDDDLLIVNKPQGLVVHPAESHHEPTLVHGLLHQIDQLSTINGIIRPGIVHRIDKDTSGLLVVAKNDFTHNKLSEDLSKHQIKRRYYALVYGRFDEGEGIIDAPLKRHPKNRLKMAVIEGGKRAVTHFKVVKHYQNHTLLSCQLETGRTHQIRVHMAFIKHPIVGDPLYGPKDVVGSTGQFLHAYELSFEHPIKKEHMTFRVDMPQTFKDYLAKLN
ncbi:MAG: RluA family pseudouridine synthase [Acholeplasmataceae bacterium]|nr:RluA family pseudouridine synthase [Acholeplasmataceae bacterium]